MIGYEAPQIDSGWSVLWPPSFCQTRDLRLIVANGLQRPIIYEPLGGAIDIGITAPTAGPTVATPAGGAATAGTYYCGYRYKDAVNGTYSSLSPLATVTAAANDQFTYSDLTASGEARVTHVEVWRSTAGQNSKLYLVATVTNGTTTASGDTDSDETMGTTYDVDSQLDIYTADGELWARRQVLPPNFMRVCVPFQDRTFWAVPAIYDVGTVSISNGSATLTGSGTSWTSALEGREVYLVGGDKPYTISTVGGVTSITLDENYAGTALSGVRYAIMASAIDWSNTLVWSEQDEPESVPSTQNTIAVQESLASDNDWISGLTPHGTQLWVHKTRHTYSVTFARQLKINPGVHPRFSRGTFNHRCADYLVDTLFLLDALGPWAIGPGDEYIPLGPPIQDYFRDSRVDFGKREWWFVSCSPDEGVVRFFVTLVGQTGQQPKTALCFGVTSKKWWTETREDAASGSARIEHLGKVRTIVGGSYDRVLLLDDGDSDGVSCQGSVSAATSTTLSDTGQSPFTSDMIGYDVTIIHGTGAGQTREILTRPSTSQITVAAWETTPDTTSRYAIHYAIRGTATSATASTLSDSTKTFSAQLAGATVAILSGTGAGQLRSIKSASGSALTLLTDWTTTPSTDSVYLVGAIECQYRTGIMEIPPVDMKRQEETERAVELTYEPTTGEQSVDWRLLWDHLTTDEDAWISFTRAGLTLTKGSGDWAVDLKAARSALAGAPGIETIPFRARPSRKVLSNRFLASELHWFQGAEPVKLYNLEVQ